MRIGILGLLHESNTFISAPTTRRHFEQDTLLSGEAVRDKFQETHHEIGGFFDAVDDSPSATAVPIYAARAVPYGTIEAAAFQSLVDDLLGHLRKALPLDGLLVAPHGATVSVDYPDADGYWLGRVREVLGPSVPIIGTLDPHANLSPDMVRATNALIAYRTNPHLDQRARGRQAGELLVKTLLGDVTPTQCALFPPVVINIERQHTSEPPCLPLCELADQQLENPELLTNSVLLGFPYADVAEVGSAALAVTDNDPQLAREMADQLGNYIWENRRAFRPKLIEVDQALDQVAAGDGRYCLLDMGDNVGGGSPADGTILLAALQKRPEVGASFVCLYDPAAVSQLAAIDNGQSCVLSLGGKTDDMHGSPIEGKFEKVGDYDGKFEEPKPRHGGFTRCDQGPTTIVRQGHLTVMLTSKRMPPFSLQQLLSCDVDPQQFRLLVAKGVNAPVAAYAPVCDHLLRVNTPGVTTADLNRLTYRHRRVPLFPFEEDCVW